MDDNGESDRQRRRSISRQQREREERAYDREQRQRLDEERQRDRETFILAEFLLQERWDDERLEMVQRELVRLQEEEEFNNPVVLLLDQIQPNTEHNREEFDNIIATEDRLLYTIMTSQQNDHNRLTGAFRGIDWPRTGRPWVQVLDLGEWEDNNTVPVIINEATMPNASVDEIEAFQWLNELRQVTRLSNPLDIYAFNMFVRLNLEPENHWVTNENMDPLDRFRWF